MTQREFLNVVVNGTGTISFKNENGNIMYKEVTRDDPEITEFAKAKVARLDEVNSARKAKSSEENKEFYNSFTEKFFSTVEVGKEYTSTEIAELVDEKPGKVTRILGTLADEGRIEKYKVKKSKPYVYKYNG